MHLSKHLPHHSYSWKPVSSCTISATISFQTCFASQTPCQRQFFASMLCVEKGGNAPDTFPPFSMQRSFREASSWPCGSWIFRTPFGWCSGLVAGWSSSQLALPQKKTGGQVIPTLKSTPNKTHSGGREKGKWNTSTASPNQIFRVSLLHLLALCTAKRQELSYAHD